jgi:hypothetical protein
MGGCGIIPIERTVHLYPTNDAASGPILVGRWVGHGNLHGVAEMTMADGEFLTGEYSIVAGGSVGFGTAFANTYGPGVALYGTGSAFNVAMSANGGGQANMIGNRGTVMFCEFANNNMNGHGFGTCKSSRGDIYRMQY